MNTMLKLAVSISLVALTGCQDAGWVSPGPLGEIAPEAPVAAPPAAEASTPPARVELQEPAEPARDLDADLEVKRLVIARGVEGREPVEPIEQFVAGDAGRIYAFVEVGNRDGAASAIFVSFVPEAGPERGPIELDVGASARWRTWAYTKLATTPGVWHAVVRDGRGNELGRARFEVKPGVAPIDPA